MVSDNLDGRNTNTPSCLDSSSAHQQTGNEKIASFKPIRSTGSSLEVLSEIDVPHGSNIIAETAAAESVSLPLDGCLNDTFDMETTVEDANNTTCQDPSCEISRASADYSGTIYCEIKTGSNVECNPNFCGKNSVNSTSKVTAIETRGSLC